MEAKLELYRIFREVAKCGNITSAAQGLYISQSAVSQAIRQLEQQLGTQLFLRNSRGVILTSEGKLLLDYVNKGLGILEAGEEKLSQALNLEAGELTIGASDTVTKTYLLPLLKTFHKMYPDIKIKILNGTSRMCLDRLHSGAVDIAFASEMLSEHGVRSTRCFETHSIFVASPDYPCDFTHPYTPQEIAQFPLILLERAASSRLYLERYFLEQGIELVPEIELGSHALLISLARISLGIACVTEEFSQSTLSRGVVLPLKTTFSIPPRSVLMYTLSDVLPTSATLRFIDYILEDGHSDAE